MTSTSTTTSPQISAIGTTGQSSVQLTGNLTQAAPSLSTTDLTPSPVPNFAQATQAPVPNPVVNPQTLSAPQDPLTAITASTEAYIKSLEALDPFTAAVANIADNPMAAIVQTVQNFMGGGAKSTEKDQSVELNSSVQNLEQLKEVLRQNILTNLQSPAFANYAAGANNSNSTEANPVVAALIKAYNSTENKNDQATIIESAIENYLGTAIDLDHQAAHLQVLHEIDSRDPNSPISSFKTIMEHLGPPISTMIDEENKATETLMKARIARLPEILKRFGQALIAAAEKLTANRAQAAQQATINPAPISTTSSVMTAPSNTIAA